MLAALMVGVAAQPAHATPHFIVGTGQNPGVAVDALGTAYIGWKVNVYADQGDAVQLCVLPAGRARVRHAWPRSRSPARATTSAA